MLKKVVTNLINHFRSTDTVEHFDTEEMPSPALHRGLIEYNTEHCIFCDRCENVCPP